jgi:undecaprenyl diphosphate synthase
MKTSVTRHPALLFMNKIPEHVAIIMDGNGRWAKAHGWPRIKGHEVGAESIRAVLREARKQGIKYLTLYAFSVENWNRPSLEVKALMQLLVTFLKKEEKELHEKETRLRMIGRMSDLPEKVQKELQRVMDATSHYTEAQLVLSLSYGGRTEIANAVRQIAEKVKAGELEPDDITEETVGNHLYAPDIPDPELLIRTSGEMRISNFLLWQISYSEIYVTDVLWPDFREDELNKALADYASRNRRFGGVENK